MKRLAVLLFAAHGLLAQSAGARGLQFFPLVPCRAVNAQIVSGTPLLVAFGNTCGIPPAARAVSVMVTITAPTADGTYTLETFPAVYFYAGQTETNSAEVKPDVTSSFSGPPQTVAIDVYGYFQ